MRGKVFLINYFISKFVGWICLKRLDLLEAQIFCSLTVAVDLMFMLFCFADTSTVYTKHFMRFIIILMLEM